MRKVATISTLVFVTLLAGMMSLARQSLAVDMGSLTGLWLFDEGAGNTTADSSGNGHAGTLMGDTKWVTGKFGGALEFDGDGDLVDTDYQSDDLNAAWTAMSWVKLTGPVPHGCMRMLVGRSNGTPQLWVGASAGRTQHKTGDGFQECDGTTTILEEWTHLAGTFDGSIIRIYYNGVEDGTLVPVGDPIPNIYTVQIGGFDDTLHGGGWAGCGTNGIIDEVAVFNTALPVDDINSLMVNGLAAGTAAISPEDSLTDTWGRIKSSN